MTVYTKDPTKSTMLLERHPCVLYVIAPDPDGPCKIGISTNIQERRDSLQSGSWVPLRVYGYRVGMFRNGGAGYTSAIKAIRSASARLERAIHEKLREMDLWMGGEWFDVTAFEAFQVADKCGEMCEVRPMTFTDIAGASPVGLLDIMTSNMHKKLVAGLIPLNIYMADHQPDMVEPLTVQKNDV